MSFSLRIEGADQLARALDKIGSVRTQRREVREALQEGAEPIRSSMARNAPRGDPAAPNLADSIAVSNALNQQSGDVATLAVGPTRDVDYGRHQEFGTARHSAQAFVRPAIDSEGARAVGLIIGALWREVIERGVTSARASGGGGGLL